MWHSVSEEMKMTLQSIVVLLALIAQNLQAEPIGSKPEESPIEPIDAVRKDKNDAEAGPPYMEVRKDEGNKQGDPLIEAAYEDTASRALGSHSASYMALDCYDILQNNPSASSGLYEINVNTRMNPIVVTVYCDMDTDGGGWTVIQRRINGAIDFYRDYQTYANGFGLPNLEHWIGNYNLYLMTRRENYELRFDLEAFNAQTRWAKYSRFQVADACDGFRITWDGYSGNAGDGRTWTNNNQRFSTFDRDQDGWWGHCAVEQHGAWWYGYCSAANPNGPYQPAGSHGYTTIFWYPWRVYEALMSTEMKIRPAPYDETPCPL